MSSVIRPNNLLISVDKTGSAEVITLPIAIDEHDYIWNGKPIGKGYATYDLPPGTKKVQHGSDDYIVDFPQSRILDESANSWHQFDEPMTLQKAASFITEQSAK